MAQTPVMVLLLLFFLPYLKAKEKCFSQPYYKLKRSKVTIWYKNSYKPIQVGRLWVVHMLSLFSYCRCVWCTALALTGLQWVAVALQFNMACGQGHVMCPLHTPVDLWHLGLNLVWIKMFPGFRWGGHVGDLDVWDAGLPQDLLRVGQLQLLHVVDGNSSIVGLL